jgi:hypothetical protein
LLIGFAFLFVEIAFILRFSLFLDHSLAAISVTLAGILVATGVASGTSKHGCGAPAASGDYPGRHCRRRCDCAATSLRRSHGTTSLGEDRRCGQPSCAVGVRHGSAISARAQSGLRVRTGPRAVGLGHQRLRVACGGCNGQPARHVPHP